MPNLYIQATNCQPEVGNTGRVLLAFDACGSDGNFTQGTVAVNFLASSIQMNSTIIDAAKAKYAADFGVVFVATDQIKLAGGIV